MESAIIFRFSFTTQKWDLAFIQVCIENAVEMSSEGEPLKIIQDYIHNGVGNILYDESTAYRDLFENLFKECVEKDDHESLKIILEWFKQLGNIKKLEALFKNWDRQERQQSKGILVQSL